jgi:hypothetical protein
VEVHMAASERREDEPGVEASGELLERVDGLLT